MTGLCLIKRICLMRRILVFRGMSMQGFNIAEHHLQPVQTADMRGNFEKLLLEQESIPRVAGFSKFNPQTIMGREDESLAMKDSQLPFQEQRQSMLISPNHEVLQENMLRLQVDDGMSFFPNNVHGNYFIDKNIEKNADFFSSIGNNSHISIQNDKRRQRYYDYGLIAKKMYQDDRYYANLMFVNECVPCKLAYLRQLARGFGRELNWSNSLEYSTKITGSNDFFCRTCWNEKRLTIIPDDNFRIMGAEEKEKSPPSRKFHRVRLNRRLRFLIFRRRYLRAHRMRIIRQNRQRIQQFVKLNYARSKKLRIQISRQMRRSTRSQTPSRKSSKIEHNTPEETRLPQITNKFQTLMRQ